MIRMIMEKLPYEELENRYKSISNLNKKYVKEIGQLKSQLQQKENIIKEVREYIEKNIFNSKNQEEQELYDIALLEILDKEK